jgi:copper chaperone CopZ
MKFLSKILMAIMILPLYTTCSAQIRNATTETVSVYGNCGACEATIEKAGNLRNVSKVDWDKDTQMATLTYDAKKTNQEEILKRIALVGYDSDQFLAPDDTYANLPACCQYERGNKTPAKSETLATNKNIDTKVETVQHQEVNLLAAVFAAYFEVKDALVQTNAVLTATKASALSTAINTVKMENLPMDVHMVWMKILNGLKQDANAIADSKNVETQRSHFINLSKNMYDLIKVANYETPVYYQHCPMANDGKGANWLSKENVVKNPYYGAMMLSCGKVVETIE